MASMDYDYKYEEEKLAQIRSAKPWMVQPKYFKRVKISPSATIKMMMHGQVSFFELTEKKCFQSTILSFFLCSRELKVVSRSHQSLLR